MDTKKEEFRKKLLEDFKIEAAEHRQSVVEGLLELEKNPGSKEEAGLIETVFREVHSLKGAARSVNLQEVERFCQAVETVFTLLKKKELSVSPELINALHSSVNMLDILLARLTDPLTTGEAGELSVIIRHFEKLSKGECSDPAPAVRTAAITEAPAISDTVRITTSKLINLFLQVEELISAKLMSRQHAAELRDLQKRLGVLIKTQKNVEPQGKNTDGYAPGILRDESGELQVPFLKSIEHDMNSLAVRMEQELRNLERIVDGLLVDMKKTMMFPISSILDVMPKMVRDISHDSGKNVELTILGSETEIDRRILEEVKDPLLHIVRNCMDYGVETPDKRAAKGKNPYATLTIDVKLKDSRNVEIMISDDGPGIDVNKVKSAAVKSGIITPETADKISDDDILQLVFLSGVSTSPIITDLSGRGIGLAIVQEKAEKLGGTVLVESVPGAGTKFILTLPVIQATFRGVMVNAGEGTFIIPLQNVEKVIRVSAGDIKTVENRETIRLEENILPLVRLDEVLQLPYRNKTYADQTLKPVLVIVNAGRHIAFMVDEVLCEQEGIIKQMGPQLRGVMNIAGATVSGAGSVIPILDAGDLIETAIHMNFTDRPSAADDKTEEARRLILVAEDSITSRSLLKNILESAGYVVKTAVDGVDALAFLRGGDFDLLVSDIEMPRMNGFDLTLQVRGDKRLTDLPVILVTALDSSDDRERGIEAGANAYIIKSSFDQSNLLEVIQRLI